MPEELSVETRAERVYVRPPAIASCRLHDFTPRHDSSSSACAQTLTAQQCSTLPSLEFIGHDQPVAQTLVVSFAVIMQYELVNSFAQCVFIEEDHSVQTGLLDAANEALRIGI
jgi:hypothetical protein